MLERLTDEDVRSIISRAVERYSCADEAAVLSALQQPAGSQSSDTTPVTQESAESNNSLYPSYPELTPRVIASLTSLAREMHERPFLYWNLSLPKTQHSRKCSLRQSVSYSYDRTGESHYDMISALRKSARQSGRCSNVLASPYANGWRGSLVHYPKDGCLRERGHRARG